MPLPNFIIFGAIKSGTGAIYQYLAHHPQIFLSPEKEPRFFANGNWHIETESKKSNGSKKQEIEEYLHYFKGAQNEKAIGEASSNYINNANAAIRIKETIPDVKLIASLRNPVERSYAHFRMVTKARGKVDFNAMGSGRYQNWAKTSLYYEQLTHYYRLFSSNQIKILIFENWTRDVPSTLKELYTFLGVDNEYKIPSKIEYAPGEVTWRSLHRHSLLKRLKPYIPTLLLLEINKLKRKVSPASPPLPEKLKREMQEWYHDDIVKLQTLLNMDLSIWLK